MEYEIWNMEYEIWNMEYGYEYEYGYESWSLSYLFSIVGFGGYEIHKSHIIL